MLGTSLSLFADLGACHVQKSSVTICVLPTPFRWGRRHFSRPYQCDGYISIHALRVEGDKSGVLLLCQNHISIHALRVEGDRRPATPASSCRYFYPRPPGGGRHPDPARNRVWRNFYPRPPGGGRRLVQRVGREIQKISIHALRVEGDKHNDARVGLPFKFLSTPSGWRATA